ncbi:Ribonuclease HII, partial [Dissostichus eleginoides]
GSVWGRVTPGDGDLNDTSVVIGTKTEVIECGGWLMLEERKSFCSAAAIGHSGPSL